MASSVVARETISSLRRQIAKIEGRLPERLATADDETVVLRGDGRILDPTDRLLTGIAALDEALAGGLPKAALTEIHGRQMRDAGAGAGFALALISLLMKQSPSREKPPLLWIGSGGLFAETGIPYLHGVVRQFGIEPRALLFAEAPRPVDALWIAEEAAALRTLAAVILELPGNPQQLDLTATRRLHRRATEARRPVFLLRHSAEVEATASPLRFIVTPAPAGMRRILGRPLKGSIGPPAFTVDLDKNCFAPPARFVLEWNADDYVFEQRKTDDRNGAQDSLSLVSLSQRGTNMAPAPRSRMAFGQFRFPAAGRQSQ